MVCYQYLHESPWLGHEYYTPEVVLGMKASDGTRVNMTMEVDSGASITLLPFSAAEALGLNFYDGDPVMLQGVGGPGFTAYVHDIETNVGGEGSYTIPVAIAPDESFPPLLGRLGFYDQASVFMSNENKAACIGELTNPPISPPSACTACASQGNQINAEACPVCSTTCPPCPSAVNFGATLPSATIDWTTWLVIGGIGLMGLFLMVGMKR